jgi:hypothetical protein
MISVHAEKTDYASASGPPAQNNAPAFGTVDTQVWELGNSLWDIQAGSIFVPSPTGNKEPGNVLEKCVTAAHGIQPQ